MLRKYVRQLRPTQENYIAPIDKVQSYLTEASMPAADWEKVICVSYNMKGGMSEEDAISAAEISEFKPKHKEVLPIGQKIIENSFGNIPSNVMTHYGQGQGTLTKEWNDYFIKYTGKSASAPTKTPKTDMKLSGKNISLKKYGGSQLMSGGQSETLATLGFAYDNAPTSIKSASFDKAWNKLNTTIEKQYVAFKLPPGGQIGKIASGKMKADDELKKLVKDSLTKQKEMTNALNEIFNNTQIKKEVVREAMSGKAKFADQESSATHMMKFDDTGKGDFIAIDEKLVDSYTNKTNFNISFKTSGTGGRAWTALKGIYKEENETLDNIITESILETDKEILQEGIFSRAVKTIKNWISRFLNKVWNKIKTFLVAGLDIALDVLGIKIKTVGDGYKFGGF
jgi:hypothetical protein